MKVIFDKAEWLAAITAAAEMNGTIRQFLPEQCEQLAPFVKGFMASPVAELTDNPQDTPLLARSVQSTIPGFIEALTSDSAHQRIDGDVYLYGVWSLPMSYLADTRDPAYIIRFAVHRV